MNENYNQVPNNDYNTPYDYNNNVAYNDNSSYQKSNDNGKRIFFFVLGIIIIIIIILLLLKFCGGSGRLNGINVGNVPIIYVGEKEEVQISATGSGNLSNTEFKFALGDEDIAKLDDESQIGKNVEAVIKGKEPGETKLTVRATLGNKHFTEKANVVVCGRLEVDGITDNTITVEVGKTKRLNLNLGNDERCYSALKFKFGTDGIARRTDDDGIEGLEAGTTTLTISDGGKDSITYDVVVIDPSAKVFATGVKLSASSISVCLGGTKTLKATVSPSNASDKSVMWSSNKTSVATVSNGRVTGRSIGTATIEVMTQDGSDKTAKAKVKVVKCSTPPTPPKPPKEVKVTSITLNPTSVTVYVNNTTTVTAGIKPTNATNKTVTCKSSNTTIFTVTTKGNVCTITGKKAGSATLTVTANDGSGVKKTASVTVKSGSTPPTPPTPTCKVTNCKTCKSGDPNYCITCNAGYQAYNGSCVSSSGEGCYCCGGSQGCAYGWHTSNPAPNSCGKVNKTKTQCISCGIANCTACRTGSTGDVCSQCKSGYTLSNGKCIASTQTQEFDCTKDNYQNLAAACKSNGYTTLVSNTCKVSSYKAVYKKCQQGTGGNYPYYQTQWYWQNDGSKTVSTCTVNKPSDCTSSIVGKSYIESCTATAVTGKFKCSK